MPDPVVSEAPQSKPAPEQHFGGCGTFVLVAAFVAAVAFIYLSGQVGSVSELFEMFSALVIFLLTLTAGSAMAVAWRMHELLTLFEKWQQGKR